MPVEKIETINRTPLAGDQITANTGTVSGTITGLLFLIGVAAEHGLVLPLSPAWSAFLSDYRTVSALLSAAVLAGNYYRKSRLKRVIDYQIDRLDGDDPKPEPELSRRINPMDLTIWVAIIGGAVTAVSLGSLAAFGGWV